MTSKPQILHIHGGETFKNRRDYLRFLKTRKISLEKKKRWSGDYMDKELGSKFEIIRPAMPSKDNAVYEEWKIHFERYIPLLRNNVIMTGNSLGSMFLIKYLSEHRFPKKILALYLVCPPFDDTLFDEDLAGGFVLKRDISLVEKNAKKITLMFSVDDDCVPISHADKYEKKLKSANIIRYKSKNGHFNVSSFPEIVSMIKVDLKRMK